MKTNVNHREVNGREPAVYQAISEVGRNGSSGGNSFRQAYSACICYLWSVCEFITLKENIKCKVTLIATK